MVPVFERKPASRTSTGRTNRDAAAASTLPVAAPNAARRVKSDDREETKLSAPGRVSRVTSNTPRVDACESLETHRGGEARVLERGSSERLRALSQPRESTAQMRERVAQNLKDDFDRHAANIVSQCVYGCSARACCVLQGECATHLV
jgi:hypothetical protein